MPARYHSSPGKRIWKIDTGLSMMALSIEGSVRYIWFTLTGSDVMGRETARRMLQRRDRLRTPPPLGGPSGR